MDKKYLETKKTWLEEELNKIRKNLDELVIQNHRFGGALGVVNDLIKELGDGELDNKEEQVDEPINQPTESTTNTTTGSA